MKVYIIEYLSENTWISKIISKVTGQKYSHTAMLMDRTFCELDATNAYKREPDYHLKRYLGIKDFLKTNPEKDRTEAFEVPYNFKTEDVKKGIEWWHRKQKVKKWYGYTKLISFLWLKPLRPFMHRYYKKRGKPYSPKTSSRKSDVCSVAVDKVLKIMGYDIFPEYVERTTYPGLFAEKLKQFKVSIK